MARRHKRSRKRATRRGGKRAATGARKARAKVRAKRAPKPARLPEVHFVGPGLVLAPTARPTPPEPSKPAKKKPTIIPQEWIEFEGEYYAPEEYEAAEY